MFGSKKTQIATPAYDRELFDAFEAGRLEPKNEDQREWFDAVKAGRLEAR